MEADALLARLSRGEVLMGAEALQASCLWPFFALPATLALAAGERDAAICHAAALSASDPDTLARLAAGLDAYTLDAPAPETPATTDAIDTFLRTYGTKTDPREEALLERLIFNPVPADYASTLEELEPLAEGGDEQDDLISAFIASHPEGTRQRPAPPEEESAAAAVAVEETSLNESLAKMYVQRGDYQRAYDLLRKLDLHSSEKSAYFADQLRFLRKLIKVSQHIKNTQKQ